MRKLSDALENALQTLGVEMRVSLPAKIESYDHTKQECEVTPLLKRNYLNGETQSMPVITGVPLIFPRSGGAFITMPVNPGDGVLLVFSDRSLDKWLSLGGEVSPDDRRMHALSDAIAIPGLNSFHDFGNSVTPADNNDNVQVHYEGTDVKLKPGGEMEITNGNKVDIQTGDATVNANNVDITATTTNNGNVTIDGNLTVTGNITASGDIEGVNVSGTSSLAAPSITDTDNNIDLGQHVHGGVQEGGSTTDGPQ